MTLGAGTTHVQWPSGRRSLAFAAPTAIAGALVLAAVLTGPEAASASAPGTLPAPHATAAATCQGWTAMRPPDRVR